MLTSVNYGYWEFWDTNPDLLFWGNQSVTFDGINKLILVNEGVTYIDVKTDIYSNWKEWITVRDNTKFLSAIRVIGGDPTSGDRYAGDIYFTINGWRVVFDPTVTRVNGVLYSDDFETAWYLYDRYGDLQPVYPNEVSNLVQSVTQDLSGLDFSGANITIDPAEVWNHSTRTLTQDVGLTATQNAALLNTNSTVSTMETTLNNVNTKVTQLPTLTSIENSTVLAKKSDINAIDAIVSALPQLSEIRDELIDVQFGGLEITNNQMIVKDKSGSVISIFDLFDQNGNPTMAAVFKRTVVV